MIQGPLRKLQGQRDPSLSTQLRPDSLEAFVGQELAVKVIRLMLRKGSLSDSILLVGAPGLGKTTLARLTATRNLAESIGGDWETIAALNRHMGKLKEKGDVLFIDEVHAIKTFILELLYSRMEDRTKMPLGTQIVAATTAPGKLPRPFYDRFGQVIYLTPYSPEEIYRILKRSSKIMRLKISEEGLRDVANRSRGVPRIANRLLRRALDYSRIVTQEILSDLWETIQVDEIGLDPIDRQVLEYLSSRTRPTGVRTVAQAVGLDVNAIQDLIEPYLISAGLMEVAPGGRIITIKGLKHIYGDNS